VPKLGRLGWDGLADCIEDTRTAYVVLILVLFGSGRLEELTGDPWMKIEVLRDVTSRRLVNS
jgi:hypothetical protein